MSELHNLDLSNMSQFSSASLSLNRLIGVGFF